MQRHTHWQRREENDFWRRKKALRDWSWTDHRPQRNLARWTDFWTRFVYGQKNLPASPTIGPHTRQNYHEHYPSTKQWSLCLLWQTFVNGRRQHCLLRLSQYDTWILFVDGLHFQQTFKSLRCLYENSLDFLPKRESWWLKALTPCEHLQRYPTVRNPILTQRYLNSWL